MSSLKFGTSGLRGLVSDLQGQPARRWAAAFLTHLERIDESGDRTVLIGQDLRSSSPAIARDCADAAVALGWTAIDCGALPTPALALAAIRRGAAAIMVTGSHIPDDRNGLKFYRRDGEITKEDEVAIRKAHDEPAAAPVPGVLNVGRDDTPIGSYCERYTSFFPDDALGGLRLAVYQQSSVARDCLADTLEKLGAEVSRLGRSDRFVPIDTEAHHPRDLALFAQWAADGTYDAIISTDGDADRPLVTDDKGAVVRGDLLALLAAAYLGCGSIVTPVTSSAAVERSGIAANLIRTRVGSPFVIEGMQELQRRGHDDILGFEANGGVLLGTAVTMNGQLLEALPTRDAFLPVLAALAYAKRKGMSLREAVDRLGGGVAKADRLPDVQAQDSGPFLERLSTDRAYAEAFFQGIGDVASFDKVDGVRFVLGDGSVIHFRASGNAPELRCYVEAESPVRADELLAFGLASARDAMDAA
ncbi:phosphomannomutase [Aureimonas altamirensis]|uniref:Phosphomannomutase n=1 Tax=Aureimonas altamirensis TaxID=370622 RepID=A0A0B1Q178_9HYPH|nr:phosphomannomutase [Aureimonas altamirensis]KHJ54119.1 phosphomannomutase [Aureimonas altamirensis]